nr:VanW family protein [Pseudomonas mandelii]
MVERSNHSFDRFPDEGRVLPFGSGAAIFYNYVDLVLHNPTDRHFQLKLKLNVGEQQLEGELLCDRVRGGVGITFIRLGIGFCARVGGCFGGMRFGGRCGVKGRGVRCWRMSGFIGIGWLLSVRLGRVCWW